MKKIHILRHAKSSWSDSSLSDFDKPLNAHGIRIVKLMASKLIEANCPFENVLCSLAIRAQSTITLINEQLPASIQWQTDELLHTFDSYSLHTWFKSLISLNCIYRHC